MYFSYFVKKTYFVRTHSNEYPQHVFFKKFKKNVKFWARKSWLDKESFDHLLVHGQVIRFANSTTLFEVRVKVFFSYHMQVLTKYLHCLNTATLIIKKKIK